MKSLESKLQEFQFITQVFSREKMITLLKFYTEFENIELLKTIDAV